LRSYWYLIGCGEINHMVPKDSHRAAPLEDVCFVLHEDIFDELLLESVSTCKRDALTEVQLRWEGFWLWLACSFKDGDAIQLDFEGEEAEFSAANEEGNKEIVHDEEFRQG
jgi:hypothetical protein